MKVFRALVLGLPIAVLSAVIVACGPGSNGPVAGTVTLPAPTPAAIPTLAPFSASGFVNNLASSLGQPIALPSANANFSGSVTIPTGSTVPPGTTLSDTVSSTLPAGLPAVTSLVRQSASSGRAAQGEGSPATALSYLTIKLTNSVFINGTISLSQTFNLPASMLTGNSFYLAFSDSSRPSLGWIDRVTPPACPA